LAKRNALDLVPVKKKHVHWVDEGEIIKLKIYRNHWYDALMHRLFKTPLEITIDLDKVGSEVWRLINGEDDIKTIGLKLKERLGDEVEPLFPRLVTFVTYLYNGNLIYYKKPDLKDKESL